MQASHALSAVMVIAISLATGASAAVTIYEDFDSGASFSDPRPNSVAAAASFDAAASALGPESLLTFESAQAGPFFVPLVVAPGVTISGPDLSAEITSFPLGEPDNLFGYNTTTGGSQFAVIEGGRLVFSFDQGIDAFGAYLTGVQFDDETMTFSDGNIPVPNPGMAPFGGVEFLGFTDPGASITSLTLDFPEDIVGVDDVRYVAAPEPASVAMTIVTLSAVGVQRRNRIL